MKHWIDNADSYICPVCRFETTNPNRFHGRCPKCGFMDEKDARSVDAVKVVHAEWLDIRFDPMWKSMLATCSHCEVRGEVRVKANECGFAVPDSDYCPHCGAKMDGGSD